MIPGIFRQVCTNGLVCWKSFGEINVPHKGDIVSQVIEGAYEVLGVFDAVADNMEKMKSIQLDSAERRLLGAMALEYKYGEDKSPVTPEQIIQPRAWYDKETDLWTSFNIVQENLIKGGVRGRTAKGKRTTTRPVTGIDGDIKLNQARRYFCCQLRFFFRCRTLFKYGFSGQQNAVNISDILGIGPSLFDQVFRRPGIIHSHAVPVFSV